MNRASGGKSTNQILLFPRLYKSKAPQLPPALLPTSFFSLLPSLFPHVQFYYFTQINVYICLILHFYYFFFRKSSGQKIAIQEWLRKCNAKHMTMVLQKLTKFYVGSASGLSIFMRAIHCRCFEDLVCAYCITRNVYYYSRCF